MSDFEQKKDEIPDAVRALLVTKVNESWENILQAMIDLATGIYVQDIKYDDAGSPIDQRVYRQKPDKDMQKYLADQVIGKAKESMNIEGKIQLLMDDEMTLE